MRPIFGFNSVGSLFRSTAWVESLKSDFLTHICITKGVKKIFSFLESCLVLLDSSQKICIKLSNTSTLVTVLYWGSADSSFRERKPWITLSVLAEEAGPQNIQLGGSGRRILTHNGHLWIALFAFANNQPNVQPVAELHEKWHKYSPFLPGFVILFLFIRKEPKWRQEWLNKL